MVGLTKARPNYFINNYVDDRSLDKSFEDDNGYAYDEYMRYDNSPSPYEMIQILDTKGHIRR